MHGLCSHAVICHNNQPSQFYICNEQVRLKCLSRIPGSHSVCEISLHHSQALCIHHLWYKICTNFILQVTNAQVLGMRLREPMLSGFLSQSVTEFWWHILSGCWVYNWALQSHLHVQFWWRIAGLFTFLYFHLNSVCSNVRQEFQVCIYIIHDNYLCRSNTSTTWHWIPVTATGANYWPAYIHFNLCHHWRPSH